MLLVIIFIVLFVIMAICTRRRKHRKHRNKRHPNTSSRRKHSRKRKSEKQTKQRSSSGDNKISHSSLTTITSDEDTKDQKATTEERGSVVLDLPSKLDDEASNVQGVQTTEENIETSMKSLDQRNNSQTSAITNLRNQVQNKKGKRSAEGVKKKPQLLEKKSPKKCVTFNDEVQVKSETETNVYRHGVDSMSTSDVGELIRPSVTGDDVTDMSASHKIRKGFLKLYKTSLFQQSRPHKHDRNISTSEDEVKVENEDANKKPKSKRKSKKKKHRKESKETNSISN